MSLILLSVGWTVMLAATFAAAWTDVRTRRIPNAITGGLAAAAIGLHAVGGLPSVGASIGVMLAAFAAGTLAFSLGWFGGGDVKLLSACCGIAGFPGAIDLVLFTLIAGGIVAVAEASRRGRLVAVFRSTLGAAMTSVAAERLEIPYAIAIALGSSAYVLSQTYAPVMRIVR